MNIKIKLNLKWYLDELEDTKKLVFFDDFEKGKVVWENGGEFNSSYYGFGSSTITTEKPFSGTSSLKMMTTGRNADFYAQSNNYRYGIVKNGETIEISYKLFIPKTIGFYYPSTDWGFFLLNQFKGVSADNKINNPLHALYISSRNSNKSQYLSVGSNARQWGDATNPTLSQVAGVGKELELPINKWITIKEIVKFGDGDGTYQVYQDDVLIFDLINQRTFRNNSGIDRIDFAVSNYGRYHRAYVNGVWDGLKTTTIYIDEFSIYRS